MAEISVIIPCYNVKKELLLRCINSVLIQKVTGMEIILVDDGSKEEYRKIYNDLLEMDARIHIHMKQNGGVSSARNHGVTHSTGKFIVFVDADDILLPNFLKEAYKTIISEGADFVIGGMIHHLHDLGEKDLLQEIVDNEVERFEEREILKLRPYMVGNRLRFNNGKVYIGRGPCARIIKRELVEEIPFETELSFCEDIVWNLQILSKSNRVCLVKRPWYCYDMGEISATRGYHEMAIEQSKQGLNRIRNFLDFSVDSEYRAFCERCFEELHRMYFGYLGNCQCTLSKKEKRILEEKIYTEKPWNVLAQKRYYHMAKGRNKLKCLLYAYKKIFVVMKCKTYLK